MKDKFSLPPPSSGDSGEQLSRHRQQLHLHLQSLHDLAWKMGDSGPLVMGSYYQVYKTCTQPNCRCRQGERHGPFPALSWSIEGKRKMVMVRQEDAAAVAQKAAAYRQYQKNLTTMRRLMQTIDELMVKIRSLLLEEYH